MDLALQQAGHSQRARRTRGGGLRWLVVVAAIVAGCTPFREYVDNGFKVGPNYSPPPAPVETQWIDADDERVRSETDDLSAWWKVFNDPVLDDLICTAYQQNLTLREAGFRVLAASPTGDSGGQFLSPAAIHGGGLHPQRV